MAIGVKGRWWLWNIMDEATASSCFERLVEDYEGKPESQKANLLREIGSWGIGRRGSRGDNRADALRLTEQAPSELP